MTDHVRVTNEGLSIDTLVRMVSTPEAGAIATFSGVTRNNFEGKSVLRLEYEAYVPMAEKELQSLCSRIREKWPVFGVAIEHRIGVVPVEEASVIIAISSAHRDAALDAVKFAINDLKARVPIWKKEMYGDDYGEWKANKEFFVLKEANGL
mmetsp:Transcript_33460/g.54269  ORF Transcript_33460/g.54269 Transcript_33460/m.54269 type:complete len:151 (-) Transcript_33460:384-836(-)|eukprot:CAMPEP_0184672882 /NCGR_PEP_ID=MMETSP0308-20130426/86343_1 /TAXON_ID=38269 /ORGANISM="Gloeochaete witrockiana, Strain SAG 46.84" /LENGTH=150 /DNA_ID=CAMNT_0027120289 /DNA_START=147 /DNA_END=599 /DNA_ORIENTATION=+